VPLVISEVPVGGRVWRITSVQNQDALLDSAEDLEHFPYGFLLWESAVALARHIADHPGIVEGRTVLELGAGVGLAGIVAQRAGGRVRQTDHQRGALQLAERNAADNGVIGARCFLADWRTWAHRETYDVIVGADITYERAMHYYLEQIFALNLAPGGTILLSDPGRPQSLEFAAHLEDTGWRVSIETQEVALAENDGAGRPVTVAVFTVTR
jgi:methyltransferase-like protein 23